MLTKLKNLMNNLGDYLAYKSSGLLSLSNKLFTKFEKFSDKSITLGIRIAKVVVVMFVLLFIINNIYHKTAPKENLHLRKELLSVKYKGPSHADEAFKNIPLIRIVAKNWKGEETVVCSAFVISDNYALTAGHCVISDDGDLISDTYDIYNTNGNLITTAKAAGASMRPDLGILSGSCTALNNIEVVYRNAFLSGVSGKFISCGFPHGAKHFFCENFTFRYISGFHYAGSTVLIPGMSGGPTIDLVTNQAIGVNVMSYEQEANAQISSLIGFDAAFDIED